MSLILRQSSGAISTKAQSRVSLSGLSSWPEETKTFPMTFGKSDATFSYLRNDARALWTPSILFSYSVVVP